MHPAVRSTSSIPTHLIRAAILRHSLETVNQEKRLSLPKLVRSFEDRSLPRSGWTHRAHLTVAAWYASRHNETEATRRVVGGIQAYNEAHGIRQTPTSGYHHTVTLFWLHCVRWVLKGFRGSEEEAVELVLGVLGSDPDLIFAYYSRERLSSWRARAGRVEPDLARLPH